MNDFTLYNPERKLPPLYRGWPATWRTFMDPIRHVAMIGGTWYCATWDCADRRYQIEEVA